MLCGVQAKGLSYQATSKMLERQANNVLKCRQRAWLSRLMSWRTLTSNTNTHTHTCFKRLNWVSGTSQLRQPLTALPLSSSHSPLLAVHCCCKAVWHLLRDSCIVSVRKGGNMAILIANRIMHFFVPLSCAINHATRMLCTHTHERAINSTFIRANLIYCLQLAGQKDTALKAFQCN